MISKGKNGEYIARCECGEVAYGGVIEDFRAFLAMLKADGWRVRKDGEEWVHECEACWEEE